MVMGCVGGIGRRLAAAGGAPVDDRAAGGQGWLVGTRAANASSSDSPRPQIAALIEVSGTVLRTILIRMLKNDPRLSPHPDLADTRPGMAHRPHQRGIR